MAQLGKVRAGIVARFKGLVAAPAHAPARYDELLALVGHIAQQLSVLINQRPQRHKHYFILSAAPGFVVGTALFAALGFNVRVVRQLQQGGQVAFGLDDHVAALAAAAAVGTAEFNELFPAKRHASVPAFSGGDINFNMV